MIGRGFKARLRYAFDKSMVSGAIALVALLALLSFAVVGVTATLVVVGGIQPPGDERMDFVEAFWSSLLHALDPGTVAVSRG
jgi:hypothetical protein